MAKPVQPHTTTSFFEFEKQLADYKEKNDGLENVLRQSQSFIDLQEDLLTRLDARGDYLFINSASFKFFGLEPHEMMDRSSFEFVHPEDRDRTRADFFDWIDRRVESLGYENRLRRDSGEVFHMSWVIRLHYDDDGRIESVYCIGKDVSSFQRNQRALRDTSSKLQKSVKELNCLYAISKLSEDENLTRERLMQSVVELMPPSFKYPDITCASATLEKDVFRTEPFRETGWSISSAISVRNRDAGSLTVYYMAGKPFLDEGPFLIEERYLIDSVCKSLGKILDRMQLTRELLEIKDRYNILTDHFADGIVVIQDGCIKFANTSFALMAGVPDPEPLTDVRFDSLIEQTFRDRYAASLATEETPLSRGLESLEYQLSAADGTWIWVEEKRNRIGWENRPALLCIVRDISEKKRLEASSEKETRELRAENVRLRSSLKDRFRFRNIIGKSPAMQEVYEAILNGANSDANIAVYGESGTGKELVAKSIHDLSPRKKHAFVPVNCGAIPEQLLESEFFGHKKGAFTHAILDKHGYLDLADKGTLFLDEIGELQLNMQAKLLRAIDDGGYRPIGSNKNIISDFRIIAATNRDLKQEIVNGNMREDFFYRIHVIPITLPPLRKRKEDIPYLVQHFSEKFKQWARFKKIPENKMDALVSYNWPGNVRELQNVLQRYFSTGRLLLPDVPEANPATHSPDIAAQSEQLSGDLKDRMNAFEKKVLLETLEKHNWHRIKASTELNVTRNTLFRKMSRHGLKKIHK